MQNFKDLKVWQRSHQLALEIYKVTAAFPREELYSLTSQLKRSATSVPTNIAEGCGRGSNADLARFLFISMGSAAEVEYQLLLAKDLDFVDEADYERLINELVEIRRMLNALIRRVSSARTNN